MLRIIQEVDGHRSRKSARNALSSNDSYHPRPPQSLVRRPKLSYISTVPLTPSPLQKTDVLSRYRPSGLVKMSPPSYLNRPGLYRSYPKQGSRLASRLNVAASTHRRNILLRKLVSRVRDEKTSFSYCSVPDNHTFNGLHDGPSLFLNVLPQMTLVSGVSFKAANSKVPLAEDSTPDSKYGVPSNRIPGCSIFRTQYF